MRIHKFRLTDTYPKNMSNVTPKRRPEKHDLWDSHTDIILAAQVKLTVKTDTHTQYEYIHTCFTYSFYIQTIGLWICKAPPTLTIESSWLMGSVALAAQTQMRDKQARPGAMCCFPAAAIAPRLLDVGAMVAKRLNRCSGDRFNHQQASSLSRQVRPIL